MNLEYYTKHILNRPEKLVCSAVWVQDRTKMRQPPANVERGYVAYGLRHGNCYEVISERYNFNRGQKGYPEQYHTYTKVQGFLTSKNRFVDRKEAAQIAFYSGQIDSEQWFEGMELHSEDLY